MKRVAVGLIALLLSAPAFAGWLRVDWDAITGATAVRLGCVAPGQYDRSTPINGSAGRSVTIEGLPDSGRCYLTLNAGPQDEWSFDFSTLTGGRTPPGAVRNFSVVADPAQPATTSWGFDFRSTAAFVIDPAGSTYVIGDRFPVTRNGLTIGWEQPIETRNRSATVDARFAGVANFSSIGSQASSSFRVTLPAPGRYRVRLAAGDAGFANIAAWEIRDDTAVLATQSAASVPQGQFRDATGVLRTSPAQWLSSNAPRDLTFATTTFRLVLIRPSSLSAVIAHLSLERL